MRIACPYCGERDRARVHLSRRRRPQVRPEPATPARTALRTTTSICATTPPAAHRELLVPRRRLPCLAGGRPATPRTHADRCGRAVPTPRMTRRQRERGQTYRLASGGLIDRTQAAATSASTASRAHRLRRRHAGLGAARQRRAAGRPLVQVSPPARHPHRRLGGAERAGRAAHRRTARAEHARDDDRALRRARRRRARTAGRRCASTSWRSTSSPRRFLGAGFYYKTFMWPAALLGEALRAADPPRRRPRPRRRRAGPRPLREGLRASATCWSIGGGPAGLGGGARGGRAGRARHPLRRGLPCSAAACSPSGARDRRRAGRRLGAQAHGRAARLPECAHAAAHARCSASTTAAPTARSSASATTCRCRPQHQPRQRYWQIVAKRAVLAAGADRAAASSSAATTGPA